MDGHPSAGWMQQQEECVVWRSYRLKEERILCEEEPCLLTAQSVLCVMPSLVQMFTSAGQSFIFPDVVERPEHHLLFGARLFSSAKGGGHVCLSGV